MGIHKRRKWKVYAFLWSVSLCHLINTTITSLASWTRMSPCHHHLPCHHLYLCHHLHHYHLHHQSFHPFRHFFPASICPSRFIFAIFSFWMPLPVTTLGQSVLKWSFSVLSKHCTDISISKSFPFWLEIVSLVSFRSPHKLYSSSRSSFFFFFTSAYPKQCLVYNRPMVNIW